MRRITCSCAAVLAAPLLDSGKVAAARRDTPGTRRIHRGSGRRDVLRMNADGTGRPESSNRATPQAEAGDETAWSRSASTSGRSS